MLLGNMMSGCSLSLNNLLTDTFENARNTEVLLSLGATRWEAMVSSLTRAMSVGITPTIQAMAVLGVVSIPGMMTGQILSGTVPDQAARYQMMIYFMITLASICSMLIACLWAIFSAVDTNHVLRLDEICPQAKIVAGKWTMLCCGSKADRKK